MSGNTSWTEDPKKLAQAVYALQAVGFFFPILWLIGVVVNYVKEDDVAGTLAETHFRWQRRSFWFGVLGLVLAVLTWVILVGWFFFAATYVFMIFRVVKGWMALNEGKTMYPPLVTPAESKPPGAV